MSTLNPSAKDFPRISARTSEPERRTRFCTRHLWLALALVFGLSSALIFAPAASAAPADGVGPESTGQSTGQSGDRSGEERLRALEEEVKALREALAALRAEREKEVEEAAAAESAEERAEEEPAEAGRLEELERRLDLLAAELERVGLGGAAAGQAAAASPAEGGEFGFAPAASKVYRTEQGLSIGGYGEMLYEGFESERDDGTPSGTQDQLDFLRAIVYFGYKFNDRILFNSEIEFEHASTGEEGSASVEFAYLDFLLRPEVNFRAGLLLVPMGFVNELHEPPVFLGARRPDVEQRLIPTTWRENGFGLFGDLGPFTYRSYVVNGLDASGFSASGVRGGRQKGSEALAEDFAWVTRFDYTGTPGLLVGGSFYTGGSGQGLIGPGGAELGVDTTLYEGHLEWKYRGFELRALAVHSELDDVAGLNQALGLAGDDGVGEEQEGYYVQVGYDLLSRSAKRQMSLIPYLRYEDFDTHADVPAGFLRDPARDIESLTLGLAFKPLDQVIVKADYQDFDNGAGTALDQFNVAIGYLF